MQRPADPSRVGSLLAWARNRLEGLEAAHPAQDARELLEWVAKTDSIWRIKEPIEPELAERFYNAVELRASRIPLQRITGRMYFRGLTLHSAEQVFICRPETEIVAGIGIEAARQVIAEQGTVRIVDLCTGSGAIAIACATELPEAQVWAVELAQEAFALAQRNIETLVPSRVQLLRGDATHPRTLADLDGRIDIVISNPPYVPADEAPTQVEAGFDPPLALFGGGEAGMDIPRGIICRAAGLLKEGGLLVLEHSASQAALMREAARETGFIEVFTKKDLAGAPRALVATRGRISQ